MDHFQFFIPIHTIFYSRCAFKNTPKYNEVLGKGKIVKRTWIEECFNQRKYLPWRRYALVSAEASKPESDEEIWEEVPQSSESPMSHVDMSDGIFYFTAYGIK